MAVHYPHRTATLLVSLLASSTAFLLLLNAETVAGQQPQQLNASSIDQHNSQHEHLIFNHHHHHHHDEGVGGPTASNNRQALESASLSSSMLRAYIRTNSMRAYHLDLHSYRHEAKLAGDPAFVDSNNPEHLQRCRRHLAHYRQLLKSFRETDPMEMTNSLESLRLADTYGRPDAGLLDGHQFWLGSYGRCLEFKSLSFVGDNTDGASDDGSRQQPIQAQYCLGLAQFPSWNQQDTKTSIKVGMCLPDTCTSSMLNEQADLFEQAQEMMKMQLGDGLPFAKLRLRSVYCLPHETSEIRQYTTSSKLFISLMSFFVVGCIYATISDYLASKRTPTLAIKLIAPPPAQEAASNEEQDESSSAASDDDSGRSSDANSTRSEHLQAQAQQQQPKSSQQLKLVGEDERTWRNILVESFSLIRNFEKLTTSRRSDSKAPISETAQPHEDTNLIEGGAPFQRDIFFNSITGLKCVGLIWIIAAHTFLVSPITNKNLIHLDQVTKTWLANLYLAAHLMVDTFFCLSGLLASYLIFKGGIHKLKTAHWVTMTVHRYWRLTPVYLICYWYAKSMGHLNNSGPLWDYMTAEQSPRLNCLNESWLEAILQMSDFKSPKSHCVPFAWFIANGIKFWIVTPLFLVAIYKSVRRGYGLVCAVLVANMALVFMLAFNSEVDMKSVIEFRPESADNMLSEMENIYTRPYTRIGAYLVGLLAGHCFYTIDVQKKRFSMSDKSKALVWSLVTATVILLTFVMKITSSLPMEEALIPWLFSFFSAIIRPLWALCTCWLVFALSHGQAKWLAGFLCASVWSLVAKISFSAYLVQGEVIANLYLATADSNPYTYIDLIGRPLIAIAATLGAAFLMALFVEYPLIGIEELILPAKHPKKSSSKTTKTQTVKVMQQPLGAKQCDLCGNVEQTTETNNGTSTSNNKLKHL